MTTWCSCVGSQSATTGACGSERLPDDGADLDRLACRALAAAVCEDLVDQVPSSVGGDQQVAREALFRRSLGGALQQHLAIAENAPENVVEIVRNATCKAPDGLHLLRLP
jgi:hypothetical protein